MAEEPDGPQVLTEVVDGVGVIRLNRPDKLNAISARMRVELDEALAWAADDDDVRVVVLTGNGRAFCAGADIGGPDDDGLRNRFDSYGAHADRQRRLWTSTKPTIAAVHGYCLGRGCELALWCDFVVMEARAKIGEPEIRQGSVVASIVPLLVGPQQAKRFLLFGDSITGEEAGRIGLVTEVVGEGEALETALHWGRQLGHIPPTAIEGVKTLVAEVYQDRLDGLLRAGSYVSTVARSMSAEEKGTAHLVEARREGGFRAFLAARDAPFDR